MPVALVSFVGVAVFFGCGLIRGRGDYAAVPVHSNHFSTAADGHRPHPPLLSAPVNQRIITFHYTLTNHAGQQLDSSRGRDPLSFLEGVGQIVPGLETVLTTMRPGDKKRVLVAAKDGYGPHLAEAVLQVPRTKLPTKQVKIGDKFQAANHPAPLTVTAVTPTHVTLDANHPLAGVDLTFDVEITAIRPATKQELANAHQCCGHHMQGGCGGKGH